MKKHISDEKNQRYCTGQYISGCIEQLHHYGMFVRLEDGTLAYIRRRELTWSSNIDPREVWQVGQEITGKVLKPAKNNQLLELSHRETIQDPWDAFVKRYHPGDVIEGTVKNLMGRSVYIEVRPGVDGLISLRDLSTWKVQKPDEIVWVGDTIEAVISHIDRETKKLRLSIRTRLEQLRIVHGVMERSGPVSMPDILNEESQKRSKVSEGLTNDRNIDSTFDAGMLARIGPILVVDNYTQIRLPLVKWLRDRGCNVDSTGNAKEALRKIETTNYGLMLIGLNSPELDGMSLIRHIRTKQRNDQIAIMSAAEWLVNHQNDVTEIGAVEVFAKPLNMDELERLLIKIGQKETLTHQKKTKNTTQAKVLESFYQLAESTQAAGPFLRQIQIGLEQIVETTAAEAGLIFFRDPCTQKMSVLAKTGQTDFNEQAIDGLDTSPVRDVIVECEQVHEYRMSGSVRERFRKLLDLISFNACIGVPIQVQGDTNHALFLLNRQPSIFNYYHLRDAMASCYLFSTIIERQAMATWRQAQNKLLLSGQLAGGFGHEVYNKLSGLEIQLRNLQRDCHISKDAEKTSQLGITEIGQEVDNLLSTFFDLKDTVSLFQQLMRFDEVQSININEVIQKAVALLTPIIQDKRIMLELDLQTNLPIILSSPIRLQQAFLNVMLNAVQNMDSQLGTGQTLTVKATLDDKDPEKPLKILFKDVGSGIHKQQWQTIFNLGFTTRAEGTGQGLYITRSLIESLGGVILVERSIIHIGTTFLIALPMISPLGEGE